MSTTNKLKLQIADYEAALIEALQDPLASSVDISRYRTGLYWLKQMLKQELEKNTLTEYCEQNPSALECRIYDL